MRRKLKKIKFFKEFENLNLKRSQPIFKKIPDVTSKSIQIHQSKFTIEQTEKKTKMFQVTSHNCDDNITSVKRIKIKKKKKNEIKVYNIIKHKKCNILIINYILN